ncbi:MULTISPECIES: endonuclease/exonuclease/phosphatase family protein [unclassified Streptomyces]|uniref:endonuclease/exonuclease/phosphatase family protein n=1 Tax=unclassified Streptomyces TaxID=2593676 RepID=UPI00382EC4A7
MRVVTWNLWWRFGPWRERQKAILTVLRELDPDVVGLQEVWAAGAENLAEWLADELGLHRVWAPSPAPERWRKRITDPDAGSVDIGNAVLSRWPVVEQEALLLPAPPELADGRAALYARVAAPAFDIPFFTTHLTSAPHASAVRRAQVTALAELVDRHRDGTPFPPVVTGDFNAWPDSDEIRLFGGTRTAPAVPGLVLHDAWDYADPTAPAATWTPENPYAARVLEPAARIDYIHVGPPGPIGEGHVRQISRAGHGPVDGVWPSDHAAVVADLAEEETAII